MKFPKHKCGLYLEHNANRDVYETVQQYLEENEDRWQFKDEDSRQRSIDQNEIWTLQWYPDTPVGSYSVAAPTLEEVLALANGEGQQ